MLKRLLIFLILNFGALALGGLLMGDGPSSEWYEGLNRAPWTPPGWTFGAAWSTIMLCFSVYMALLWPRVESLKLLSGLYGLQLLLNIGWNPVFFHFHSPLLGFGIIIGLTLLIAFILFFYWAELKASSLLLLPYLLWLIVATSLNGYVVLAN
jgi:benzodiazapine receptor